MRLMVTRPEPDGALLKAHLAARGHEAVLAPLLVVDLSLGEPIETGGVQAYIATSRNGLRALALSPAIEAARDRPVYCIGPGTAATARALAIHQVIEGPRAAAELVQLIVDTAEVNGGPLVHLAGETLAFDVAGELTRLGYTVLAPVVYRVSPVGRLPRAAVEGLVQRAVDGVILLSPQTGRIYARLVAAAGLAEASRGIMHFCLSTAVAATLGPLAGAPTAVADAPSLDGMLAVIDAHAAELGAGRGDRGPGPA
jgi:uroporphyrinogen-III synthase